MDQAALLQRVMLLIPLILSLTVHEFFHAWTAWRLGDDTAARARAADAEPAPAHRPRRDHPPAPRRDPLRLGEARPGGHPPDSARHLDGEGEHPHLGRRAALEHRPGHPLRRSSTRSSSAAAPGTLRGGAGAGELLEILILVNVGLAIFNLLPIPPLDGSHVAEALIPARFRGAWEAVRAGLAVRAHRLLLPGPGAAHADRATGCSGCSRRSSTPSPAPERGGKASMAEKRPLVVSGMRPTGRLHLGHLHGALANWVKLQADHDCYFFSADWHALTTSYDRTEVIKQAEREMFVDFIAAGIDPQKRDAVRAEPGEGARRAVPAPRHDHAARLARALAVLQGDAREHHRSRPRALRLPRLPGAHDRGHHPLQGARGCRWARTRSPTSSSAARSSAASTSTTARSSPSRSRSSPRRRRCSAPTAARCRRATGTPSSSARAPSPPPRRSWGW